MATHDGVTDGDRCPKCGVPYGERRRCYWCRPGNPTGKKRRVVDLAPAERQIVAEVDAMRKIVILLGGLDDAAVARIFTAVTACREGRGGDRTVGS